MIPTPQKRYVVLEYTPIDQSNPDVIPWPELLEGAVDVTDYKYVTSLGDRTYVPINPTSATEIKINGDFRLGDSYATIGSLRDDGDVDVFATLNNEGKTLSDEDFAMLIFTIQYELYTTADMETVALNRQDAPDVISLPDDLEYRNSDS